MVGTVRKDGFRQLGPALPEYKIDWGLRSYLQRVYGLMGCGLGVTGAVAALASTSGLFLALVGTPLFWVILFAPLVLVFLLSFRIERMSIGAAHLAFWSYAALVGLSLGGLFLIYTGVSLATTFFAAAAMFLGLSLYGYMGRSLEGLGPALFAGLIAIVLASVVNVFLGSSGLDIAISAVGIVVFSGLAAWDTQRIKAIYDVGIDRDLEAKSAILGALTLYLDFLNLFLMLLRFMGRRHD